MRDEDRVRLRHMIDAGDSVERFLHGRTRVDLEKDEMLLFAVIRAIEILGEAAGKLSEDTRAQAPAIPWTAIVDAQSTYSRLFRH